MKNFKLVLLFFAFATSLVSCDNNDELLVDLTSEFDAEILVTEDGFDNVLNASIDIINKHDLKVRVTYTSENAAMRRLYITVDTCGRGEAPFELILKDETEVTLKGDGSIDLEKDYKNGFDFEFDIKAPNDITNGTVVYKFWTTSGRGDFRDDSKRKKLEVSTITLKYGNETDAQAPVKEFIAKLLAAPLADKTSNTFMSLLDGNVYNMNQGVEFVAFWDFGFLYGATMKAGLYSVSNYPKPGFDIASVNNEGDALNVTKFKLSEVTATAFEAIERSNELDDINAANITATKVQNLQVGDIIEFVDNYGKKGLIKVISIVGNNGSTGEIVIDIKMQA